MASIPSVTLIFWTCVSGGGSRCQPQVRHHHASCSSPPHACKLLCSTPTLATLPCANSALCMARQACSHDVGIIPHACIIYAPGSNGCATYGRTCTGSIGIASVQTSCDGSLLLETTAESESYKCAAGGVHRLRVQCCSVKCMLSQTPSSHQCISMYAIMVLHPVVYYSLNAVKTITILFALLSVVVTSVDMVTVVHTGCAAQPCHSHAATLLHHRMFVFGGTQNYHQSCPALRVLDLTTHEWEEVRLPQAAPQAGPLPCFSHSLTAMGGLLVLAGGCHTLGAGQ